MPIAITDEQRALAESVRDWGSGTRTGGGLAGIGLLGIALPERLGGSGAAVADLAAGVAAAAAVLAPGPVFGSLLAGLVLTRSAETPVAGKLVPALADGSAHAAVALGPGELTATTGEDGGLVVSGRVSPVLDATPDAHLLLAARTGTGVVWFVVPPGAAGVAALESLDPSREAATVELSGVPVPADAVLPAVAVDDLAATLAAAEAAGVADWCVRTAAEYAAVREQFGKPIGSFQAVKHLCAEMLCRAELAAALAWDAATAWDEAAAGQYDPQAALSAAVAAAGALDAAVDNAKDCIQVLGGIGFTWEHDAHRYLRRAVSLRQWLGGSARWRRRAGELTLAGTRRHLDVDLGEVAAAETTERARRVATEIAALEPDAQRVRLAETGYLMPHWPAPYGLDATPAEQLVIDAELDRAGVRKPDLVIGGWAVPTILEHGTDDQRERFVAATLRGEVVWCQLFSEPGAGSDLAGLRTKARRVEGGWRLTGQKVWTSLAGEADWAICLARTNPDVAKHKGITYFLVDMRAEGLDVRPLHEITGEARFNEVFLDDVFVPDADVVGEVDGGWRLARTTLANERVAIGSGPAVGEGVERLVAVWPDIDPERLGEQVVLGSAVSVLGLRDTLRRLAGGQPGPESSVCKLLGVRHRQAVAEVAFELTGEAGIAVTGSTSEAQHEFLVSRCLSIAGGTTQVLLNVVAERLLGLPRS